MGKIIKQIEESFYELYSNLNDSLSSSLYNCSFSNSNLSSSESPSKPSPDQSLSNHASQQSDLSRKMEIHCSVWNNDKETLRQLCSISTEYVNHTIQGEITPLHIAAFRGFSNCVESLIEYGASVMDTNEQKNTPLHLAALQGHLKVVKILLSNAKIDVNALNKDLHTPLHLAALQGHPKVVEVLLDDKRVEPDLKESNFLSKFYSSSSGLVKVFSDDYSPKMCLKEYDYLSIQSPFHLAIAKGHVEIVKTFLKSKK